MSDLSDFKRILVAIDFSDGSILALDRAAAIARASGGELLLLHVVVPTMFLAGGGGFGEQSMAGVDMAQWMRNAETMLEKVGKSPHVQGLRVRRLVCPGHPGREIVDIAEAEGIDLIVIGSAGHAAATYALFGSTAERVARKAPCPVLITRPRSGERKTA